MTEGGWDKLPEWTDIPETDWVLPEWTDIQEPDKSDTIKDGDKQA
jgi:hypothetical protein